MYYVYRAYDETGRALYVGQTEALPERLRYHRRTTSWWSIMDQLVVTSHVSRREAYDREEELITDLRPIFQPRYSLELPIPE